MLFEYDTEVDALFIWFSDENVDLQQTSILGDIWPTEANEHIGLLFDENKKLLGLEILFASKYLNINYIKSKNKTSDNN